MTNLELAICEAENAGEIDLDTRDMMLGILNESTAQARRSEQLIHKIEKLRGDYGLCQYTTMNTPPTNSENRKKIKDSWNKQRELKKEIKAAKAQLKTIDPKERAFNALDSGRSASYWRDDGKGIIDDRKEGKKIASKNPWRGNSKREPEVKGKYKTTSGLKESVLEEIYEAELCGDITPEERMALIDYMNI